MNNLYNLLQNQTNICKGNFGLYPKLVHVLVQMKLDQMRLVQIAKVTCINPFKRLLF